MEIDQYYPQVHHEFWPPPYPPVPRHHHEPPVYRHHHEPSVYRHPTLPKSQEHFQKHSNWSFDVIQEDTLLHGAEGPHSNDELVHEVSEEPEAEDNSSEITIDDAVYLALMDSPRITSEEESDDTTDQEEVEKPEGGDIENIEDFSANESDKNFEFPGEEETLSNLDNQSNPENDNENDLFNLKAPNPLLFPNVGEDILFLDKEAKPNPRIVKAQILPMFKSVQRRWPGWFNVRREDNKQGSVNLHLTRWKISQIDGNLSVSNSPSQNGHLENIDLDSPFAADDGDFIDDNVFGDSHIEYLTNNDLNNTLSSLGFNLSIQNTLEDDSGRAFNLVQSLNLELPELGTLVRNRVYKLPPLDKLIRSRNLSISATDVGQTHPSQSQTISPWLKRWQRLRVFLSRIKPFRK